VHRRSGALEPVTTKTHPGVAPGDAAVWLTAVGATSAPEA